jgi:PAS domain S-box-containing protein
MANGVLREIVEALPMAVYVTDAEGRLTYFNQAAVKLSGRVPELGTNQWYVLWKLFLADGSPLAHEESPMATALQGGEPSGIECLAKRPDGTHFWFTASSAVLRDANGKITGGIHLLEDITEKKEKELEGRDHFRAMVETSPECVKIVAADGTLLQMNAVGIRMAGASLAEELIGSNVYDLIAPEDRDRFREFNQRVCHGETGSLAFDMINLQGARRQMETHATPLHQYGGRTVQLAITRDVTERSEAERASLLLGEIVNSSDDAIISKNLDGVITSWNIGAERLFGYRADEVVGQPVTILIPADRLQEEPRILNRLKRGERVDHFETIRKRKDGVLLDISLTISPVKDRNGKIVGVSKIARDITERKRVQAALETSESRFRQLADSMPQMVWTARPDGLIDYYNERWYEFAGFDSDRVGEINWESILHPEDLPSYRAAWSEAVRAGTPYNIEHRFWDPRERRWRWFMGRAVPVYDAGGDITKWFGSCIDIDDQKRIEEDLRRANQNLEQFAYSASHDLQEPLRNIKIYSELLADSQGIDSQARRFLEYLHKGASRMEMLVRDLLTYTQVTSSAKQPESADAGKALEIALDNLASAIAESGAQIIAGELPSIRVHEAHLQQLFQNLIGNAIKYRSPDRPPSVRVTAERENGSWVFAVNDNGIGIEAEYKDRIFGLFKRLHTNEEYSGTGIGLAICQRIVEQYHGQIWVESEPGRGSTFRFTLPA